MRIILIRILFFLLFLSTDASSNHEDRITALEEGGGGGEELQNSETKYYTYTEDKIPFTVNNLSFVLSYLPTFIVSTSAYLDVTAWERTVGTVYIIAIDLNVVTFDLRVTSPSNSYSKAMNVTITYKYKS